MVEFDTMKLAFYYHITMSSQRGKYLLPSYLGVFLEALAKEVQTLKIIFHEANQHEVKDCDYELTQTNISYFNLGLKTPAWHRTFFQKKILGNLDKELQGIDAFLVRTPTPLAHQFKKYIKNGKIVFLIVGDYADGALLNHHKSIRDKIIGLLLNYINKQFEHALTTGHVIVNSPALFVKYKNHTKSLHQIKTTTLSQKDFFQRDDTFQHHKIKVLYAGRFDLAKGLIELVEAFNVLYYQNTIFELHFVGWEYDENEPVKKKMAQLINDFKLSDVVFFHGKKKVGNELNEMYRMADVYVIPSYHEGFPRTIWEAMANSLPVIASRVGAIPTYLSDNENVILINPKQSTEIVDAIQLIETNKDLRKKIIANAFDLVKENTLEYQTKKLVGIIENQMMNE
jgi:glycosyltransferase involved in cell wall biosynthesis